MVQAAGIPDFSTKSLNSGSAFPKITPCPQTIRGFFDLFINYTASKITGLSNLGVGV